MKMPVRAFAMILLLALTGCIPQERIWWSPAGDKAVVAAGTELHLAKVDGDLIPIFPGAQIDDEFPIGVSWLPDGTGFVIHRVQSRATWAEARVLLPENEATDIERRALGVPGLLQAAAAMATDADAIESLLRVIKVSDIHLMSAAIFCAHERQKETVEAAVLKAPNGASLLAQLKEESARFRVHEICIVKLRDDKPDGEPQAVVRSINPLLLPSLSPKFPAVAYWRVMDDDKTAGLEVSSLDGKARLEVLTTPSTTFDWMPDGRSLVFAAPVSDGDRLFQSIQRVTVLQESGAVAEQNPERTDLAVGIMTDPPRVCALPDGRILFASQPATLPVTSNRLDPAPRLFIIAADGQSVTSVSTNAEDLPANLSFFVPSPDGKQAAVVESGTDAVAVVDLATGKTEVISPTHTNWESRTMPAWKSSTELTFAALAPATKTTKWMLWTRQGGVRSISERWPANATSDWLSERKQDSNAAAPSR